MVRPLSLAQHTLYADLLEQGLDDLFDPDLPENGSVLVRGNRAGAPAEHAYYQGYRPAAGDADRGQRYARYLGRADDPEVAARIARFQRVKAVRSERTSTVRALIGGGLPRPDRITGRIIEALARAGLFSEHAVLIGDAAYQTYSGILGMRLFKLQKAAIRNGPAIEIAVRDRGRMASLLDALRTVDATFTPGSPTSGMYRSANGVQITINGLDLADRATSKLFAFLITDPVPALVLHGPGIPVSVPAPERFVAYTMIRYGQQGSRQPNQDDLGPVRAIMSALCVCDRQHRLDLALSRAFRDPTWQAPFQNAVGDLPEPVRATLRDRSHAAVAGMS